MNTSSTDIGQKKPFSTATAPPQYASNGQAARLVSLRPPTTRTPLNSWYLILTILVQLGLVATLGTFLIVQGGIHSPGPVFAAHAPTSSLDFMLMRASGVVLGPQACPHGSSRADVLPGEDATTRLLEISFWHRGRYCNLWQLERASIHRSVGISNSVAERRQARSTLCV
jgi:hypothetical protein